jgi:hypothetical protein
MSCSEKCAVFPLILGLKVLEKFVSFEEKKYFSCNLENKIRFFLLAILQKPSH